MRSRVSRSALAGRPGPVQDSPAFGDDLGPVPIEGFKPQQAEMGLGKSDPDPSGHI
jgi:hypothetical protein